MSPLILGVLWSTCTITFYLLAKILHRNWPVWWLAPIIIAPLGLIAIATILQSDYDDYNRATHWLIMLLGPATVAFAIPIYEQRALIRRHWPALMIGMIAGSSTAFLTAWGFAKILGLSDSLRLSLLPRSFSTPFAMTVSSDIGGIPEMTALFVIFTGILGAAMGEIILHHLPIRTALAKGALFGMGAHAVGVTKARQMGPEEGSIAGVVMVLAGVVNVFAAPFLAMGLQP